MEISKLASLVPSRGRILVKPCLEEDIYDGVLWHMERESMHGSQIHQVILCGELVEDIQEGDYVLIYPHQLQSIADIYEPLSENLYFIHETSVLATIRN